VTSAGGNLDQIQHEVPGIGETKSASGRAFGKAKNLPFRDAESIRHGRCELVNISDDIAELKDISKRGRIRYDASFSNSRGVYGGLNQDLGNIGAGR